DGKILLHADGTESKRFDIKDGTAIVWAQQRAGLSIGFLSARSSAASAQRAAQLGVSLIHQGVPSKLDAYVEILLQQSIACGDVDYMGDAVLAPPVRLPAARWGKRGSATSCATGSGSIGAGRESRPTTSSASTSSSRTRSISRSRS